MGYTKETLPALFIPNTYEVYWNMSADAFMKRMQKEHAAFWNKERRGKAANIGLSPEEVATLASIVEEETANNAEKPMVAGLYINRLNKGMLLQADPTVKFGLQEFGLNVSSTSIWLSILLIILTNTPASLPDRYAYRLFRDWKVY